MAVDYYAQTLALNDRTGLPVPNAVAQVYAMTDTAFASPLPITDMTDLPVATLQASPTGIYPAFKAPGHTQVLVRSGEMVTPLTSWYGVLYEVGLLPNTVPDLLRAAEAAEAAAAAAAESAAEAAASAGGGGGGGGSGESLTYSGTAWPARPSTGLPVTWVSTKHPAAPMPPSVVGDIWIRATGALEQS